MSQAIKLQAFSADLRGRLLTHLTPERFGTVRVDELVKSVATVENPSKLQAVSRTVLVTEQGEPFAPDSRYATRAGLKLHAIRPNKTPQADNWGSFVEHHGEVDFKLLAYTDTGDLALLGTLFSVLEGLPMLRVTAVNIDTPDVLSRDWLYQPRAGYNEPKGLFVCLTLTATNVLLSTLAD